MKRSVIRAALAIGITIMISGCASIPSLIAHSEAFSGCYPIVGAAPSYRDNSDGTITDNDWVDALAWVQAKNTESYLGYSDWRLPNIKELQSIVDYSCSPTTINSAAIDALFLSTAIKNEAGQKDYGYYWSSTTHQGSGPGAREEAAAYVSFGRGMGKMLGIWMDVHGAGCQRSDPKVGSATDFPDGRGLQGDAIRIDNFVRLVRDPK